MKAKVDDGPGLFDFVEIDLPPPLDPISRKMLQDSCHHKDEVKTLTIWPGESHERMTWTCANCGKIRGRC